MPVRGRAGRWPSPAVSSTPSQDDPAGALLFLRSMILPWRAPTPTLRILPTAYARHLAERLGIDLIVKRGSDLLDMFVGGTEANIARAFAESSRTGGLLLIDEADDFLFDRREATHSWERAPVNEMLRQMEALAAPFVATTNLADRLDPATQRRFTARATFRPMTPTQSAALFARHFRAAMPDGFELHGQTPGDFATVAARADLLGESAPATIRRWLQEEAVARGEFGSRMGF